MVSKRHIEGFHWRNGNIAFETGYEQHMGIHSHLVQSIFKQIVSALEHIHSKQFVYRNLESFHVLISSIDDDGDIVVKLCDFGATRSLQNSGLLWVYRWQHSNDCLDKPLLTSNLLDPCCFSWLLECLLWTPKKFSTKLGSSMSRQLICCESWSKQTLASRSMVCLSLN